MLRRLKGFSRELSAGVGSSLGSAAPAQGRA